MAADRVLFFLGLANVTGESGPISRPLYSADTRPFSQLLRSPLFHRIVQRAHKQVHNLRHGKPPEEMGGGMNIERELCRPDPMSLEILMSRLTGPAGEKGFIEHFVEEIKQQLPGGKK